MTSAGHWYLIHTKPRQESVALENLERQGYRCYLPMMRREKVARGRLALVDEPLFPRYLFIWLESTMHSLSWTPIRSTRGVTRLVTFGKEPARVPVSLIEGIQQQQAALAQAPARAFTPGEGVLIVDGPFAGIEAIYHESNGERRVMVLIELMNRQVKVPLEPHQLTPRPS
jgi:transcriptional antiterminator RfaH